MEEQKGRILNVADKLGTELRKFSTLKNEAVIKKNELDLKEYDIIIEASNVEELKNATSRDAYVKKKLLMSEENKILLNFESDLRKVETEIKALDYVFKALKSIIDFESRLGEIDETRT